MTGLCGGTGMENWGVKGVLSKMHIDPHDLFTARNIIVVMKRRKIIRTGNVVGIWEKINK